MSISGIHQGNLKIDDISVFIENIFYYNLSLGEM